MWCPPRASCAQQQALWWPPQSLLRRAQSRKSRRNDPLLSVKALLRSLSSPLFGPWKAKPFPPGPAPLRPRFQPVRLPGRRVSSTSWRERSPLRLPLFTFYFPTRHSAGEARACGASYGQILKSSSEVGGSRYCCWGEYVGDLIEACSEGVWQRPLSKV